MKKLILIVFFFAFSFNSLNVFCQVLEGKYERKLDTYLDGFVSSDYDNYGLEIKSSNSKKFTAIYWGIENESTFKGEIYDEKVIKFIQSEKESGYYAVYAGTISDNGKLIKGSWYDMRGNSGDFEFRRKD